LLPGGCGGGEGLVLGSSGGAFETGGGVSVGFSVVPTGVVVCWGGLVVVESEYSPCSTVLNSPGTVVSAVVVVSGVEVVVDGFSGFSPFSFS